jgi:hypothetical protein
MRGVTLITKMAGYLLLVWLFLAGQAIGGTMAYYTSSQDTGGALGSAAGFAPTGVTASETGGGLLLSWTAPAGGWATGYGVYRSTESNGPYTLLASGGCASPVAGISCTDTTVANRVTYYYVVRGISPRGGSATNSIEASGVVSPPEVVSTIPLDHEVAVNRSIDIQVLFSKAMNQTSVFDGGTPTNSAFCMYAATSTCAAGRIAGTARWSGDGRTFVFAPSAALTSNMKYRVAISTQARDTIGIPMEAPYDFVFTTSTSTDGTRASVSQHWPANNGTNLPVSTVIGVDFNEAMDQATTEAAFCMSTGNGCTGTVVAGVFSWANGYKTLSFKPSSNLANSNTYYVRICGHTDGCATTARDRSGNMLTTSNGNSKFNFTTGALSLQKAIIDNPIIGAYLKGASVPITGTAGNNSLSFKEYGLQYGTAANTCGSNVLNSSGVYQYYTDATYPNGVTDGLLGTWDTTRAIAVGATPGMRYLCLSVRDDSNVQVNFKFPVVIDNKAPVVTSNAQTMRVLAGQSLGVTFGYNEEYPDSYIIRACSNSTSDSTCASTKIAETIRSSNLPGGTSITLDDNLTINSGASNGTYDLVFSVTDKAGNNGRYVASGKVVVQSAGKLTLTAGATDLAPGQSTVITATLVDAAHNPLSGRLVSFTKDNACAGSSLVPASATTNGSGEAVTTLTVCTAVFTYITVSASATVSGTTVSNYITIYDPPLPAPSGLAATGEQTISIRWQPSNDRRVVGYRLEVGNTSGKYNRTYDTKTAAILELLNGVPGATYYVVARSYDNSGRISQASSEIVVKIPAVLNTPTTTVTPVPSRTATPSITPVPISPATATPTAQATSPVPTPTPVMLSFTPTSSVSSSPSPLTATATSAALKTAVTKGTKNASPTAAFFTPTATASPVSVITPVPTNTPPLAPLNPSPSAIIPTPTKP